MGMLGILDQMALNSGRLEKERILNENKDNEDLKNVFRLAYDPQINFFTRQIPDESVWGSVATTIGLSEALDVLENRIFAQKIRGGANETLVESLFENMSPGDCQVLKRVILHDLRIGATRSTANKVWPGLFKKMAFMLADTRPIRPMPTARRPASTSNVR